MSVQHAGVSHELPQRHGANISFFPYLCCSNGWCLFSFRRIIESGIGMHAIEKKVTHIYFVTDMRLSPRIATRTILLWDNTFLLKVLEFPFWRICRQQQQQSTSRTWQQGGISLYSSLWLSIADDKCWFHQPEITFGETRQIICPWIICCRHNVASSIICFPIQMWRSIYSFEWNNKDFLVSMCKFPAYPLPRIYQVVLITLPVAVLYRFPKLCAVILHVR
jgi:hypothetical protein